MCEDKPRDSSGESVDCDDSSRENVTKQNVTECECIGPHTEACQNERVAYWKQRAERAEQERDTEILAKESLESPASRGEAATAALKRSGDWIEGENIAQVLQRVLAERDEAVQRAERAEAALRKIAAAEGTWAGSCAAERAREALEAGDGN